MTDFAPTDQQEDLDDIEAEKWFHGATLWSTDWTAETVLSQLIRKNINLNPRFQRRNAWTSKRKSLFIESLILGLPIPQLVLAEDKTRRGSFIVIDGKQRLLSLRQFAAKSDKDEYEQLRLQGLEERNDLNGLSYEKLKSLDKYYDDLNAFDNQTIRTVVIRNWTNEAYLYSVFLRINTGSVQLSAQELRQALHPGYFSDYVDETSISMGELQALLGLEKPDFRMRDAELLLRFFAYKNNAGEYSGNLKAFLDKTTKMINKNWNNQQDQIKDQAKELKNAIVFTEEVFGKNNHFRKWNGSKFESRINRAVFDVMFFYFSSDAVRRASEPHREKIPEEFKRLCVENASFLASLERTTKSKDANEIRFRCWANALSNLTGKEINSPL